MTELVDVEYLFESCYKVTGTIPAELFANNPKITDFSYVFSDCSLITGIPEGLFDN
jgi:hypothetical protein